MVHMPSPGVVRALDLAIADARRRVERQRELLAVEEAELARLEAVREDVIQRRQGAIDESELAHS